MKKIGGLKKSGFTLIELLVVVFIIGVLATTVTVALVRSQKKSNDAKRMADINTLRTAFGQFYEDNGRYPKINNSEGGPYSIYGLQPDRMDEIKPYLSSIPVDPAYKRGGHYRYGFNNTDPIAYVLLVIFEIPVAGYAPYDGKTGVGCKIGVNPELFGYSQYPICHQ